MVDLTDTVGCCSDWSYSVLPANDNLYSLYNGRNIINRITFRSEP